MLSKHHSIIRAQNFYDDVKSRQLQQTYNLTVRTIEHLEYIFTAGWFRKIHFHASFDRMLFKPKILCLSFINVDFIDKSDSDFEEI